ncbi:core-2/I-Branching enzyme domain-containing protein [Ditylenchus destructor]|nr:core-2/I-Branching enzyme domain-containing protein [Ditylenchus destructor]
MLHDDTEALIAKDQKADGFRLFQMSLPVNLAGLHCRRLRCTFLILLVFVLSTILLLEYSGYSVWRVSEPEFRSTESSRERLQNQYMRVNNMLAQREILEAAIDKGLPDFRKIVPSCTRLAENALQTNQSNSVREARQWKFDEVKFRRKLFGPKNKDKCKAIKDNFAFLSAPLSTEEEEYPLAYGMLVYKSSVQVYFLLSAIYQPQNAYCIAVDTKASLEFKRDMELLSDCFPNIFVMQIGNVEWCGFAVVRGVFNCLRFLSQLNHNWRYFQYLSGVDLPLKTNLEMVRIFKRLKGTVNAEVTLFQKDRLGPEAKKITPPLPLWKSSLSSLMPRETVDAMLKSEKVRELFNFLKDTSCADETLWATITGNKDVFPIPGAIDATEVFAKIKKEKKQLKKLVNSTKALVRTPEEPFPMRDYYISRYQVWVPNKHCAGKFVATSCVYGVGDLDNLMTRPELVAHKFYLDFEPAAYFCTYQAVRQRALVDKIQQRFQGALYSQLPQVRMQDGQSVDQLQFFFTDW